MSFNGIVQDLRGLFLNHKNPLLSLLNLLTFFLIAWALNPEAIYYNWMIWATAVGLWSLLALLQAKNALIQWILYKRMWLLAVWPAYTMLLWLSGHGVMHRKFIAIAFAMAMPFYYILSHHKKDLAALSRLGVLILTLVAVTTLFQMRTHPNIARELAVGRGVGNFRASALLGNFHTVYEAVLLTIVLTGLFLSRQLRLNHWGWLVVFVLNLALVLLARYDIAIIALSVGFVFLIVWLFLQQKSNKKSANGSKRSRLQKATDQIKKHTLSEAGLKKQKQMSLKLRSVIPMKNGSHRSLKKLSSSDSKSDIKSDPTSFGQGYHTTSAGAEGRIKATELTNHPVGYHSRLASKATRRRGEQAGSYQGNSTQKAAFSLKELLGTSFLYLIPAGVVLVFRTSVDHFINLMDYETINISEKLFNRIWVYLRSLFLYSEFPLLGFGVQPDPTQFLSGQHSDYLEILAEYGIIGFIVFLLSWLALLLTMRSYLPQNRRGIFWIAVITFHILFVLNPVLEVSSVTMLFFILPGILMESGFSRTRLHPDLIVS